MGKKNRVVWAGLVLLTTLSVQGAWAHEFTALLNAKKYAEADRAALARLAADPNNADALTTRIAVITAQPTEVRLEEGMKLAEQCVAVHPNYSKCHEARANVLGTKAITGGIMSAMGYATKIRDGYIKAIELDPKNLSARFSLLQYYQVAPMIVGGGTSKAKNLIAETNKVSPEASKLMLGLMDLADDKFAQAEAAALACNAAGNDDLLRAQRDLLINLGSKLAAEKRYADADRQFQEIQKRFPESYWGHFGIGRVLQEQGKPAEALAQYDKALAIENRPQIHYRMGQCLQALKEKARAIDAYDKALSTKPGLTGKLKSDAEDQLKALRS